MKKILIWWHRRRAASHSASSAHKRSENYGHAGVFSPSAAWNDCWATWHIAQIKRLGGPSAAVILLIAAISLHSSASSAAEYFTAIFLPCTNGQTGLYWSPTNQIANNYLGACGGGQFKIPFSFGASNGPTILTNPVKLWVQYPNSTFSPPYIFDTNNVKISFSQSNAPTVILDHAQPPPLVTRMQISYNCNNTFGITGLIMKTNLLKQGGTVIYEQIAPTNLPGHIIFIYSNQFDGLELFSAYNNYYSLLLQ